MIIKYGGRGSNKNPILEQYYLHTNGDLILKSGGDVDDTSTFCVKVWNAKNMDSPEKFLLFLSNAYILGADFKRLVEIGKKNELENYIPEWREKILLFKIKWINQELEQLKKQII